jgi:carboxyl-terminal processing protease
MYNDMIPVSERDELNSKMQAIDAFLRANYLHHDQIDSEKINNGIFSGYISGIGDRNAVYMTAEEFTNRQNIRSGRLITTGISVEREGSDYIRVTEIYPGSDADSSGVLRNDIITVVDGHDVRTVGQDAAVRFLDGIEGTRVDITIQREGVEIPFSLLRQAIDIISVESALVDNIAFVRITAFSELTASQFETALQEFAGNEEIKALLIDVRGVLSNVLSASPVRDMLNLLIGANIVAHTEHRGGIRREFISTDDTVPILGNIPVIVLTDLGTSGAGELLAAALKSFANAQIIGQTTAGNSYLLKTQSFSDGSAMRITEARISLTCGLVYAEAGLSPDFTEEAPDEINYTFDSLRGRELVDITDPQIRKAFEIIQTMVQ